MPDPIEREKLLKGLNDYNIYDGQTDEDFVNDFKSVEDRKALFEELGKRDMLSSKSFEEFDQKYFGDVKTKELDSKKKSTAKQLEEVGSKDSKPLFPDAKQTIDYLLSNVDEHEKVKDQINATPIKETPTATPLGVQDVKDSFDFEKQAKIAEMQDKGPIHPTILELQKDYKEEKTTLDKVTEVKLESDKRTQAINDMRAAGELKPEAYKLLMDKHIKDSEAKAKEVFAQERKVNVLAQASTEAQQAYLTQEKGMKDLQNLTDKLVKEDFNEKQIDAAGGPNTWETSQNKAYDLLRQKLDKFDEVSGGKYTEAWIDQYRRDAKANNLEDKFVEEQVKGFQSQYDKYKKEYQTNLSKKAGRSGAISGYIEATLDEMTDLSKTQKSAMRTYLYQKAMAQPKVEAIEAKTNAVMKNLGLPTPEELALGSRGVAEKMNSEISKANDEYSKEVAMYTTKVEVLGKTLSAEWDMSSKTWNEQKNKQFDQLKKDLQAQVEGGLDPVEANKILATEAQKANQEYQELYKAFNSKSSKLQSMNISDQENLKRKGQLLQKQMNEMQQFTGITDEEFEKKYGISKSKYQEKYQIIAEMAMTEMEVMDKAEKKALWDEMNYFDKVSTSTMSGFMNLSDAVFGGAKYFAPTLETPDFMMSLNNETRGIMPNPNLGNFTAASVLDPNWWIENVSTTAPLMLPGMAVASGVTRGALSLMSKTGLSLAQRTAVASMVGGASSRLVEAPMEGFGAYTEALANGASYEEANRQFNEVTNGNLALMVIDAVQLYDIFKKSGKIEAAASMGRTAEMINSVVTYGGKAALQITTGGAEEVTQEGIIAKAADPYMTWQKFLQSDAATEIFWIGGVMETGMSVGMGGFSDRSAIATINKQVKSYFDGFKAEDVSADDMKGRLMMLENTINTLEAQGVMSEAEIGDARQKMKHAYNMFTQSQEGILPFDFQSKQFDRYSALVYEADQLQRKADDLDLKGRRAEKEIILEQKKNVEGQINKLIKDPEEYSYSFNDIPISKEEFESFALRPENKAAYDNGNFETDDVKLVEKISKISADEEAKLLVTAQQAVDKYVGEKIVGMSSGSARREMTSMKDENDLDLLQETKASLDEKLVAAEANIEAQKAGGNLVKAIQEKRNIEKQILAVNTLIEKKADEVIAEIPTEGAGKVEPVEAGGPTAPVEPKSPVESITTGVKAAEDFDQQEAEDDLEYLEGSALNGKLTPEKFEKSIFGQNASPEELADALKELEADPKGFVAKLRESFDGEAKTDKLKVKPNEGYSFEYNSEDELPNELKGIEPVSKGPITRGGKTTVRYTFKGQDLIDAGMAVDENAKPEIKPIPKEPVVTEKTPEYTIVEDKKKGRAILKDGEYVADDKGQVKWYDNEAEAKAELDKLKGVKPENKALKDIESTDKALEKIDDNDYDLLYKLAKPNLTREWDALNKLNLLEEHNPKNREIIYKYAAEYNRTVAEAYHKAKEDGSNPELVAAVEKLLGVDVKPKDQKIEAFQLVENEGKWKATTTTYKGREIGNWVNSHLDKQQQKEYNSIKDAAETYGTKEQAEENLKKLKAFEEKNKEAFEKAKQEIDDFKQAEESAKIKRDQQQKIFDKTSQDLDKLSDEDFEKLVGLIDEKRRKTLEQRFGDRVGRKPLFSNVISESYHQAKEDGSNPELVAAVEKLLGSDTKVAKEPAVESEGKRLSNFKKGDVVTKEINGKLKEYTIENTSKSTWQLKNNETGQVTDFNPDNNSGFNLKEETKPEGEPEVKPEKKEKVEKKFVSGSYSADLIEPTTEPNTPIDVKKDIRRGYRVNDGKKFFRPEKIDEPVTGNETEVFFTPKMKVKGKYVILEADEVQQSHYKGEPNMHFFLGDAQPKLRKDKNYMSKAGQIKAMDLQSALATEGPIAYFGAPVVNERGELVQGTGRTEGIKVAYNEFPQSAAKYKQYLIDNAARFGLDPEVVKNMKHPILTRMIPVNDDQAIIYGNYNELDMIDVGGPRAQAIARVRRADQSKLRGAIDYLLKRADPDDTMNASIRGAGEKFLDMLLNAGAISRQEALTGIVGGQITIDLTRTIEDMLRQVALEGAIPDLVSELNLLPVYIAEAFDRIVIPLISVNPDRRILDDIHLALIGAREYLYAAQIDAGLTFEQWINKQETVLSIEIPAERYSPIQLALTKMLVDIEKLNPKANTKTKKIAAIFKIISEYQVMVEATSEGGQMDMMEAFGRPVPEVNEALNKAFADNNLNLKIEDYEYVKGEGEISTNNAETEGISNGSEPTDYSGKSKEGEQFDAVGEKRGIVTDEEGLFENKGEKERLGFDNAVDMLNGMLAQGMDPMVAIQSVLDSLDNIGMHPDMIAKAKMDLMEATIRFNARRGISPDASKTEVEIESADSVDAVEKLEESHDAQVDEAELPTQLTPEIIKGMAKKGIITQDQAFFANQYLSNPNEFNKVIYEDALSLVGQYKEALKVKPKKKPAKTEPGTKKETPKKEAAPKTVKEKQSDLAKKEADALKELEALFGKTGDSKLNKASEVKFVDILMAAAKFAYYKIENFAVANAGNPELINKTEWKKAMIEAIGDRIIPYLESIWNGPVPPSVDPNTPILADHAEKLRNRAKDAIKTKPISGADILTLDELKQKKKELEELKREGLNWTPRKAELLSKIDKAIKQQEAKSAAEVETETELEAEGPETEKKQSRPNRDKREPGRRPPLSYHNYDKLPKEVDEFIPEGRYGSDLDKHQRFAVNMMLTNWLTNGNRAFLLNDSMGVGKTRQIIAAAVEYAKRTGKPVLIVTENKTIIETAFIPDALAMGIDLDKAGVKMVTYDGLKKEVGNEFGLVVYDEAQNMKNNSGKYQASTEISTDNILFSTATPGDRIESSIYFMADLMNISHEEYAKLIGVVEGDKAGTKTWQRNGTVSQAEAATMIDEEIQKAYSDGMIIRREYPYWGTTTNDLVDLTPEQEAEIENITYAYDSMIDRVSPGTYYDKRTGEAKQTKGNRANKNDKRYYGATSDAEKDLIDDKIKRELREQKINMLDKVIETYKVKAVMIRIKNDIASGKSVVVVSQYVNEIKVSGLTGELFSKTEEVRPSFLQGLKAELIANGIPFTEVTGTTDKTAAVQAFQNGEVNVIIGSIDSMSVGISLDDTTGNRPRTLYVAQASYDANKFSQVLGRVSRRNSATPAEAVIVYGKTASETSKMGKVTRKTGILGLFQGQGIDPATQAEIDRMDEFEAVVEKKKEARKKAKEEKKKVVVETITTPGMSGAEFIVVKESYDIKDFLKSLGARWDAFNKGWKFPIERKAEIEALMDQYNAGTLDATAQNDAKGKFNAMNGTAQSGTHMASGTAPSSAGRPIRPLVSPITGMPVMKVADLILETRKRLGIFMKYGYPGSPKAIGSYKTINSAVTIKHPNDLDTIIHEAGHYIQDVKNLTPTDDRFDSELEQLWIWGSAPPDSLSAAEQQKYLRGEGIAEFTRAYILNPSEARRIAPTFYDFFESQMSDADLENLKFLSDAYRALAGLNALDRITATEVTPEQIANSKRGNAARIRRWFDGFAVRWGLKYTNPSNFNLGFWDKLNVAFGDRLSPIEKAQKEAMRLKGQEDVNPSKNPYMLARLFAGIGEKIGNIQQKGWVRKTKNGYIRSVDVDPKTGVKSNITIAWMMEPLAMIRQLGKGFKNRMADIVDAQQLVGNYMVSKRTIELSKRFAEETILGHYEIDQDKLDRINDQLDNIDKIYPVGTPENKAAKNAFLAKTKYTIDVINTINQLFDWVNNDYNLVLGGLKDHPLMRQIETRGITGIGLFGENDFIAAKKALDEINKRYTPEQIEVIKEGARRYQVFADQMLLYLMDHGRISPEQVNRIKKLNAQYVALQRLMDSEPGKGGDEINIVNKDASGRLSIDDAIKGSFRTRFNPYENLMSNMYKKIEESDANYNLNQFVEVLRNNRGMNEGSTTPTAPIGQQVDMSPDATADPNKYIVIYNEGVREVWEFTPEIHKALSGMYKSSQDSVEANTLFQLWGAYAKVVRFTVTKNPFFAFLRNVPRDVQSRAILSRTAVNPGIKKALREKGMTDADIDMLMEAARLSRTEADSMLSLYGGGQSGYYLKSREHYYAEIYKQLRKMAEKGSGSIVVDIDKLKQMWESYDNWLASGERLTRVSEYQSAYKHAKTKLGYNDYDASLYAAYQARDLMDFAKMGATMKYVNQILPFSNANLQGTLRMFRAFKEDLPGTLAKWSAIQALPSLGFLALAIAGGYEDEYMELPAHERDLFFNFKLPGLSDQWIRIPKPFELGVLGTSVERLVQGMATGDMNKAFSGHSNSWSNAYSLFSPKKLLINSMGAGKPIIEASSNFNFFYNDTIINPWEESLPLSDRKGKRSGSYLGNIIMDGIGVDSRKVDHVIRSYFTFFGDMAIKTVEMLRPGKPEREDFDNALDYKVALNRYDAGKDKNQFVSDESYETPGIGDDLLDLFTVTGIVKRVNPQGFASISYIKKMSKDYGLSKTKDMDDIKNSINAYSGAETKSDRADIVDNIIERADYMRPIWIKNIAILDELNRNGKVEYLGIIYTDKEKTALKNKLFNN